MPSLLGYLPRSGDREPGGEVVPIGLARRAAPFLGDDAELVAALRRGDRSASGELVRRYGHYVEFILARIMGPDAELPDLLHTVFVIALKRIQTLAEPRLLKEWLRGITLLVARNTLRTRRRRRWLTFLAPEELPDIPADTLSTDASEALVRTYRTLEKLPTEERIAFTLRFVEGMEVREVAETCEVSLSTIKRRLERAQERFGSLARRDPMLRELMERGHRWGQP